MKIDSREAFLKSAATADMHSAYLIICSCPGVAKRLTDEFLLRLYCKNGGCGSCPDCRKVSSGHIDIMRLCAPRVDEFREAISFVAEKADTYKAVVIENADNMTDAAANSMLKTLERPPGNTVFILEARSAAGVLPTVASRCAAVHIAPDKDAESSIKNALGVNIETARILSGLTGGFVDEAVLLYKDSGFWDARSALLDICDKLLYQSGAAISQHAQFLESNKERLVSILGVMQSYFRDILVYKKTSNPSLLINCDRAGNIAKAASNFTSGAISNIINVIFETERRFFFSVNFRLAVEKMLFDILEEKTKWKR